MIWFALRRYRGEAVAVAIGMVLLAALALLTGRAMVTSARDTGLDACLASGGDCDRLVRAFEERFGALRTLIVPLVLLPALFGALVAAPLVAREVESGAHRFLWTQAVTRRRWVMTALAVVGGLAGLTGILYLLVTGPWLDVVNRATGSRFEPGTFDVQGIVPLGYLLFATALGVLAGAVVRRSVPAVAATIATFVVVRLAVTWLVRPRLVPATTMALGLQQDLPSGSWVMESATVDATGRKVGDGWSIDIARLGCEGLGGPNLPAPELVEGCIEDRGVHVTASVHLPEQFWTVQVLEFSLYAALAALLALAAVRHVERRID